VVTVEESAVTCPSCGVYSTSLKEDVTTRPKDLPYGLRPVLLCWHKRRWRCREVSCARESFTETLGQVPRGARTTMRLRAACADAVAANRSVEEVARAHRVSWPTAQRAVDARAARVLGEPALTRVLGIDETRFGRPRWVRDQSTGTWRLTDPWQSGFVDLHGGQGLLGQVTGRTSAAVVTWLEARGQAWRDAVQVVAIDPAAPYRTAVRRALPHAVIVVDHFHLVALANQAVTRVRQRVTRERLGRRGRATDAAWANRRLLLRGREHLSKRAFARLWNGCLQADPSHQLLAAWIAKEEMRALLGCAGRDRDVIAHRLWRFYDWCARVEVPEVTTLAETVQAWWPEILAFLQLRITNAGTEGTNRLIKQVKRHACGFRNEGHYHDRVRLHSTHNRTRVSARINALPAQR
jgi:transposase